MTATLLPAEAPSGFVWMEGEKATATGGDYKTRNQEQAGERQLLVLDSTDSQKVHRAEYSFSVPKTGTYDIWVLSTTLQEDYASRVKWFLDQTAPQAATPSFRSMEIYRTSDTRQIPVFWNKLASPTLNEGPHMLGFLSDAMRTMSPRFFLHSLDAVVVVPSTWNWTPEGLKKPFDASKIKLAYAGGNLSAKQSERSTVLTVKVKNKISSGAPGEPRIFAELLRNGEVVSRVVQTTGVPMSEWEVGRDYGDNLDLLIPFNTVPSVHEVRTGFVGVSYNSSDVSAKVGELTVGRPVVRPSPLTAQLSILQLPTRLAPGTVGTAKISVKIDQSIDFNLSGYLAFWKEDMLHGVVEIASLTSSKTASTEIPLSFSFIPPPELREGNYQVRFGLHRISVVSDRSAVVEILRPEKITTGRPLSFGKYLDKMTGQTHFWYVNQASALIWDGEPFIPVGGMWTSKYLMSFDAAKPEQNQTNWEHDFGILKQMKEGGVKDLYINTVANGSRIPAWAWQWMIDQLEQLGFTYGLQFNGRAPETGSSDGYLIRANESGGILKVDNVSESGEVSLDVAASLTSGLVQPIDTLFLVVNTETGKVVQSGSGTTEPVVSGKYKVRALVRLPDRQPHTVYFTPRVKFRGSSVVNIWEGGVATEKILGQLVSSLDLGPKFRHFVDPIVNESGIINSYESIVMDSPVYRGWFGDWLKEKYGTLESLNTSWKMESPLPSFESAAALIPLQTGPAKSVWENRTVLIHPPTGNLYFNDARTGVLWDDHLLFRDQSFASVNNRVADAIAAAADAPVVYKHVGVFKRHNINPQRRGGFAGLGGEIYGDNLKTIFRRSGDTYAVAGDSRKTIWYLATETHLDEDIPRKVASGQIGYPDKESLHRHFDSLITAGAKGIYDFLFHGPGDTRLKFYSHTAKPEQFAWLEEYRNRLLAPERLRKLAHSFPEIYTHSFYPPGEMWWFNPNQRTAVLPGDDTKGAGALKISDLQWALPTSDWNAKTNTILVSLENAPATTLWGQALRSIPDLKKSDRTIIFLGHRINLGAIPQLDQYFTGEMSMLENGDTVQILRPSPTSEILKRTPEGKVWSLRDGKLRIIANGNWLGPDHCSVKFVGDP